MQRIQLRLYGMTGVLASRILISGCNEPKKPRHLSTEDGKQWIRFGLRLQTKKTWLDVICWSRDWLLTGWDGTLHMHMRDDNIMRLLSCISLEITGAQVHFTLCKEVTAKDVIIVDWMYIINICNCSADYIRDCLCEQRLPALCGSIEAKNSEAVIGCKTN